MFVEGQVRNVWSNLETFLCVSDVFLNLKRVKGLMREKLFVYLCCSIMCLTRITFLIQVVTQCLFVNVDTNVMDMNAICLYRGSPSFRP